MCVHVCVCAPVCAVTFIIWNIYDLNNNIGFIIIIIFHDSFEILQSMRHPYNCIIRLGQDLRRFFQYHHHHDYNLSFKSRPMAGLVLKFTSIRPFNLRLSSWNWFELLIIIISELVSLVALLFTEPRHSCSLHINGYQTIWHSYSLVKILLGLEFLCLDDLWGMD